MGLFGIAIGKKATAAKAAVKLEKLKARQAGKTDRTEIRQAAKVEKATVKAAADSVAYENGIVPTPGPDPTKDITGFLSNGIGSLMSTYGGFSQVGTGGGAVENTPGQVAKRNADGSGVLDPDFLEKKGVSTAMIIGGIILLFILMKKK